MNFLYIVLSVASAALKTNFNINSSDIKAFGQNGNTAAECIYFLDKNLNLYNLDGYDKQASAITDRQSYFIALVYIYIDGNGVRKYTSLDPWKLASDQEAYMWWSKDSSWGTDRQYGIAFGDQEAFHVLLDEPGTFTLNPTHYEQYILRHSEGKLYEKWYDYYRIVCAGKRNQEDGGMFTLQSVGTFNIADKSVYELCNAYRNGEIKFSNTSNVSNNNMIFYYINDYKKMGISNMVCKPLSSNDYINIMDNYDTFVTFLNELDPDNQYHLAEKLYDKTRFKFDSSNGEILDNPRLTTSYQDLLHSKLYWYYDTVNQETKYYVGENKEHIQIGYDLKGDNPDEFVYKIHEGADSDFSINKLNPRYLTYCLFGPSLSV